MRPDVLSMEPAAQKGPLHFLGQPPGGTPRARENISTTEFGRDMSWCSSSSSKSAGFISLARRNRAISQRLCWMEKPSRCRQTAVDFGIRLFHFAPTVSQSHGRSLLPQIGETADSVFRVHTSARTSTRAGIERQVVAAHYFREIRALVQRVDVKLRVTRGIASAATTELKLGWLVPPLMEAIAPSATSTPASEAFSSDAESIPLVSCVWK